MLYIRPVRITGLLLLSLVQIACPKTPREPQGKSNPEQNGTEDDFRGAKNFRGIRTMVVTDESASCIETTKKIDALYAVLNKCSADDECTMLMRCDGMNKNADTAELQRLIDSKEWNACALMHGPCRGAEVAVCRKGRCIPKAE